MFIIRKKLSASEGTPPDTRYNPETDTVETSVDGTTWTPNPGADPRSNPAYLLPPNTASDVKCAAAGGMVAAMRGFIDSLATGSTLIFIGNAVLAFAVGLLPIGWMWALAIAVGDVLFQLGLSEINTAFTEDVYDDLLCIFYCHLDDEGRLSAEALGEVQADIDDKIGNFIVSSVMSAVFLLLGYVGMSNAGAKNADAEADCSECACAWCYQWDFADMPIDGVTYQLNFGFGQLAACGLETTDNGSSSIINAQIFFPPTVVDKLTFGYQTGNDSNGGSRTYQIRNNGVSVRSGTLNHLTGSFALVEDNINVEIDEFFFTLDTNGGTQKNCGLNMQLTGEGDNPFPESNCEGM